MILFPQILVIRVFLVNIPSHWITCLQIDWNQSAEALHNWIRGNDKVPGAWAEVDGQVVITDVMSHSLEFFNHLISSGQVLSLCKN